MSLKLGNTNIAGTQILYSTTGNNTDGAMTQAATTTALGLKANDADVIHKTGNEIINGEKTFTNTIIESTSGTTSGSYVDFIQNINNASRGTIRTAYNSDGSYSITLGSNGPDANAPEGIKVTRNSSTIWATAPASDVNGSIVTTVNKSKATNGYFQLGNGLIINWGSYTYSDGSTHTITFPKAFSSTNYSISFGHQLKESNTCDFYVPQITNGTKSTTSCTVFTRNANTARSANVMWIAIGY